MTERRFLICAGLIILLSLGLNLAGNNVGLDQGVLLLQQPIYLVSPDSLFPPWQYGVTVFALYDAAGGCASRLSELVGAGPLGAMGLQRAGRWLSALLGALCTLCMMFAGRFALDRMETLLVGLITATLPGLVLAFHEASVNAAVTLPAVVVVALIVRISTAQQQRLWPWLLLALAYGLTVALKESMYTVLPAGLLGALLYRLFAVRSGFREIALFALKSAAAGLLAIMVYLLVNLLFGDLDQLYSHLAFYMPRAGMVTAETQGQAAPWHSMIANYLQVVRINIGCTGLVWVLLGLGLWLQIRGTVGPRARALAWIVLSLGVAHYLLYAMWIKLLPRQIKTYDVLIIAAAAALPLAGLLGWLLRMRGRLLRPIGMLAAAALLSCAIVQSVIVDLALLHPTAEQPIATLAAIPGRYTLWSDSYLIRLSPRLARRIELNPERPEYLLVEGEPRNLGLLRRDGYALFRKFEYPSWIDLLPAELRLQRRLYLFRLKSADAEQPR